MVRDRFSGSDLQGTVRTTEHGDVKVHTYVSPEDGLLTNTPIIEGPRRLIIFDGQFFLRYAREAAAFARSLGKPVDRIVLSHIHLDHWSGLGVFAEQFPDAPIYPPVGVADYLTAHGQKILDARRPAFGDEIPQRPTIPTHVLDEGTASIDGVRFQFSRFVDAESAVQLVAIMPEQRTLLAFDLAFRPEHHVFTMAPHFDNWIEILRRLHGISTYDAVLTGHGAPTDRSAIKGTISHLEKGRETYAVTKTAGAYAEGMKARFPQREHRGWIELSASLLYEVIDAYVTERREAS